MFSKNSLTHSLFSIALPITAENLLQTLVGMIDTWIIAQLGLSFVTAVSLANNLIALYLAIFMAISIATSAILARQMGAKQLSEAGKLSHQIIGFTVLFGLGLGIISIFAGQPLLQLIGSQNEITPLAYQYLSLVGGSIVLLALMTVLSSILRVVGQTKFPLWVNMIVNLCNLCLSFILTFGFGSIPALGITGVALGTVVSRLLGCIILIQRFRRTDLYHSSFTKTQDIKKERADFIRLVLPILVERLMMRGGQVIYLGIIVSISPIIYAAHSITGTIESFVYMPVYGFAGAATILIAQSIGEKNWDNIQLVIKSTLKWAVLFLSILAAIQYVFATFWTQLFTTDSSASPLIIQALAISSLCQPFLAISQVVAGALQGANASKSPFWSTMMGMWGIRLIGIYLFGVKLGWGIQGIWMAILLDLVFRSLFLLLCWHHYYKKILQP